MNCPACGSKEVWLSRRGGLERVLGFLPFLPYRPFWCSECGRRFWERRWPSGQVTRTVMSMSRRSSAKVAVDDGPLDLEFPFSSDCNRRSWKRRWPSGRFARMVMSVSRRFSAKVDDDDGPLNLEFPFSSAGNRRFWGRRWPSGWFARMIMSVSRRSSAKAVADDDPLDLNLPLSSAQKHDVHTWSVAKARGMFRMKTGRVSRNGVKYANGGNEKRYLSERRNVLKGKGKRVPAKAQRMASGGIGRVVSRRAAKFARCGNRKRVTV